MVVGFPPGGQTDFAGRVLLAGLQSALGQAVIIDNKAGVNGNIAAVDVMKAPPDGYKLLVGNGSMTIASHVYTTLGIIDPRQLTPIGVMLQSALVLAVPATSPIKTYADFVELVKAKGKSGKGIDYGTGGVGALPHVTMELLRERLGSPTMNHVPYKGSSPAMTDLIAGRLDAMFDATSVVAPFIKSGQLRPLLVTSDKRVPAFPDVPTAAEAGLKDFNIISFIGLYGPPNLPRRHREEGEHRAQHRAEGPDRHEGHRRPRRRAGRRHARAARRPDPQPVQDLGRRGQGQQHQGRLTPRPDGA